MSNMGSLKLPNQYLLILEESNPEERLNKVIAYSNDDNSATMSKLTAQGSHDRQATELPVVAALVLSGL